MRYQWGSWLILAALATWSTTGCGSGDKAEQAGSGDHSQTSAGTTGDQDGSSVSAKSRRPVRNLHPEVVINTSAGRITLRLDAEKAPLTVDNFLTYVESGHYDGTIFHEVNQGYVILGGGFMPQLEEKPTGVAVRNEADNGLKNLRGTVAMARALDVIDSSTCQFFINLADNPQLDHQGRDAADYGFCVFGEVVEGLDVVEKISQLQTRQSSDFHYLPAETVLIKSARRLR